MNDDKLTITTIESRSITPEQVEAEAKRYAMKWGGTLLIAMAENRLTEKQLAEMLEVPPRQIRSVLLGEGWRHYQALAALCLALGIPMELK